MHTPTHQEKNARLTERAGTHYLREFLMLFLAVFCGILAEYQLEHTIEKDREKQYIRSGKKLSCIVFIHEFVLMYKLSTYIYMIKL